MTTSIQCGAVLTGFINRFYSNTTKGGEKKIKSITYLETRVPTVDYYWKEFYSRHYEIILDPDFATDPYVIDEKFLESEADYTTVMASIKIDLKNLGVGVEGTTQTDMTTCESSPNTLPKLLTPQFSGDLWSISKVQQLFHLKNALSGKAADRLKNLIISETNYAKAWPMLDEL